ncbi:ABC transporter permease [Arthrobacter sp. MSA 4-2]|uniref:ABC transporter permease n=1 Tax=Arthrobacter sp. MSA 4-2 TaxID=2794349 RepID=UPI0018E6F463|nr:ABC transporter permease [Arthrobacter sp. MSA 4-2]MBJ2121751.1 ABC transporter permease [Arthrobacter sp. MSA 4-2]
MSTSTSTPAAPARARRSDGPRLNFGRVLRSEWIKVTTVPSTLILLASTLVVMVGLAALFAWSLQTGQAQLDSGGPPPQMGPPGEPLPDFGDLARGAPSSGIIFGQLLIASLAVVLIASEWATGMIRSTMVAVPKRVPALLAKNVIAAAVSFLIGAAAALLSYLVAQPILAVEDLAFALSDDNIVASILNTGTYLALIAVISMGIGTLLRNTAGGVVTAVGLFFVLPVIVVNLISGLADWIPDAARFLPTNAGERLVAVTAEEGALTQLEGGLVMAAWAVVLLVASLLVTRRRDV